MSSPFENVQTILDSAVGGSSEPVGAHGAFWRGTSRNEFVGLQIFGLPLVSLGDGKKSNLVKALRGEAPFGADLPSPPAGSRFSRMPAGFPPVSTADILYIEQWIDRGCPETFSSWRATSAPKASSRYDDVWFHNPRVGWAVNSNGQILHTEDGGDSWTEQLHDADAYMRCVAFSSETRGWVGLVAAAVPGKILYETSDGGRHWSLVAHLPANAPDSICGIWAVDDLVVYAAGTNHPELPPRMMKTTDGGKTWHAWDMRPLAHSLIDIYFTTPQRGWVVGGRADDPVEPTPSKRILRPAILFTEDGGQTWNDQVAGIRETFPLGEWGWKLDFVDDAVGFISLQNYDAGAILCTTDGGATWVRRVVNDAQTNANLEGVGFIDAARGWVGGWGDRPKKKRTSSETFDGGRSWRDANHIGRTINRFRLLRQETPMVAYSAGETIYKYTDDPVPPQKAVEAARLLEHVRHGNRNGGVNMRVMVPEGAKRLLIRIWDPDGPLARTVLDEDAPASGPREVEWDGKCDDQTRAGPHAQVLRVTVDEVSESRLIRVTARRIPEATSRGSRTPTIGEGTTRGPSIAQLTRGLHECLGSDARARADYGALVASEVRRALQGALELELATLPLYMTASWSIIDQGAEAAALVHEIFKDEMWHLANICNLLAGAGGVPHLRAGAPKLPGPLPGGVHPRLIFSIDRLSRAGLRMFMELEHPELDIVSGVSSPDAHTVGALYRSLIAAISAANMPFDATRQIARAGAEGNASVVSSTGEAIDVLLRIVGEGEGTSASPDDAAEGDRAHFYRFAELYYGRRLEWNSATSTGTYSGDELPMPATFSVAEAPTGGWRESDVPQAVWRQMLAFDALWATLLDDLDTTWRGPVPDAAALRKAIVGMRALEAAARELMANGYLPRYQA